MSAAYETAALLALDAAREAGRAVMEDFGAPRDVAWKNANEPVTAADHAANRILHEHLRGPNPDYGWLSEETRDGPDRLGRHRVWVVDPIDGTRSFVAGRPEFSISIALVEDGVPVAGVVHNPAAGESYVATRGGGALVIRSDGAVPLPLREAVARAPVLLASHEEIAAGEFAAFDAVRPASDGVAFELRAVGSTAWKLALVAAGAGDAFVSRGPKNEWDVCAGVLLVQEAGGRATDIAGGALAFNRRDTGIRGILAARAGLHGPLCAAVARMPATERMLAYDLANS